MHGPTLSARKRPRVTSRPRAPSSRSRGFYHRGRGPSFEVHTPCGDLVRVERAPCQLIDDRETARLRKRRRNGPRSELPSTIWRRDTVTLICRARGTAKRAIGRRLTVIHIHEGSKNSAVIDPCRSNRRRANVSNEAPMARPTFKQVVSPRSNCANQMRMKPRIESLKPTAYGQPQIRNARASARNWAE